MKGRTDPAAHRRGTAGYRKPTEIVPAEWSGAMTPTEALAVPVPRALPKTKAVKQLWHVLLQEAAYAGGLRQGDLPSLEALCAAVVRHREAGMMIKKYGMMIGRPAVYDGAGNKIKGEMRPTVNPFLRQERDAAILIDRLAQRFGLSAESRIRLDLQKIVGMRGVDDFLNRELARVVDEAVSVVEFDADGMVEIEDDDDGSAR